MEPEETDAEEYGVEPAESPQNIKLLDDLEALRAELEGAERNFRRMLLMRSMRQKLIQKQKCCQSCRTTGR